jgi:hypothetical protein
LGRVRDHRVGAGNKTRNEGWKYNGFVRNTKSFPPEWKIKQAPLGQWRGVGRGGWGREEDTCGSKEWRRGDKERIVKEVGEGEEEALGLAEREGEREGGGVTDQEVEEGGGREMETVLAQDAVQEGKGTRGGGEATLKMKEIGVNICSIFRGEEDENEDEEKEDVKISTNNSIVETEKRGDVGRMESRAVGDNVGIREQKDRQEWMDGVENKPKTKREDIVVNLYWALLDGGGLKFIWRMLVLWIL